MEPGIDLSYNSPSVSTTVLPKAQHSLYCEAIGRLMYMSLATRPDISYAVSTLSHYMQEPRTTHWHAILRVFKYLKGTRDYSLTLGGKNTHITGYSDADWAQQMHRHSISGYAFFIGSGIISWSSKKQPVITLSSTESEYVALTHALKELIWIRKLFTELIHPFAQPTTLFCDNQGAIVLSKDSTFHAQTKHIDVQFHFIRQTVSLSQSKIKYCPTDDMIADAFTKPLKRVKLARFRTLMGLAPSDG